MEIAPSVLNADFSNLSSCFKKVDQAGIDFYHIDIMDGHFVPNISFGPAVVENFHGLTNNVLEAHMMVSNPSEWIEPMKRAGIGRYLIHVESTNQVLEVLDKIKKVGMQNGIVVSPGTPISFITDCLRFVDQVLVMTVNPGFGGQKFIPQMLHKVEKLNEIRNKNNFPFKIEVDGGINDLTIKQAQKAGADIAVVGSFIFSHPDVESQINKIKKILK